MYRLGTMHRVIETRTDRQTDDINMPILIILLSLRRET